MLRLQARRDYVLVALPVALDARLEGAQPHRRFAALLDLGQHLGDDLAGVAGFSFGRLGGLLEVVHSALMLASRMTFAHLAISSASSARSASGVLPEISMPCAASLARRSGSSSTALISRLRR